ncbi:MAG: hypothetical protein JXO44_10525 [Clostridia bacterium]|nr:hypothetical protein [Clostridia bacterium]
MSKYQMGHAYEKGANLLYKLEQSGLLLSIQLKQLVSLLNDVYYIQKGSLDHVTTVEIIKMEMNNQFKTLVERIMENRFETSKTCIEPLLAINNVFDLSEALLVQSKTSILNELVNHVAVTKNHAHTLNKGFWIKEYLSMNHLRMAFQESLFQTLIKNQLLDSEVLESRQQRREIDGLLREKMTLLSREHADEMLTQAFKETRSYLLGISLENTSYESHSMDRETEHIHREVKDETFSAIAQLTAYEVFREQYTATCDRAIKTLSHKMTALRDEVVQTHLLEREDGFHEKMYQIQQKYQETIQEVAFFRTAMYDLYRWMSQEIDTLVQEESHTMAYQRLLEQYEADIIQRAIKEMTTLESKIEHLYDDRYSFEASYHQTLEKFDCVKNFVETLHHMTSKERSEVVFTEVIVDALRTVDQHSQENILLAFDQVLRDYLNASGDVAVTSRATLFNETVERVSLTSFVEMFSTVSGRLHEREQTDHSIVDTLHQMETVHRLTCDKSAWQSYSVTDSLSENFLTRLWQVYSGLDQTIYERLKLIEPFETLTLASFDTLCRHLDQYGYEEVEAARKLVFKNASELDFATWLKHFDETYQRIEQDILEGIYEQAPFHSMEKETFESWVRYLKTHHYEVQEKTTRDETHVLDNGTLSTDKLSVETYYETQLKRMAEEVLADFHSGSEWVLHNEITKTWLGRYLTMVTEASLQTTLHERILSDTRHVVEQLIYETKAQTLTKEMATRIQQIMGTDVERIQPVQGEAYGASVSYIQQLEHIKRIEQIIRTESNTRTSHTEQIPRADYANHAEHVDYIEHIDRMEQAEYIERVIDAERLESLAYEEQVEKVIRTERNSLIQAVFETMALEGDPSSEYRDVLQFLNEMVVLESNQSKRDPLWRETVSDLSVRVRLQERQYLNTRLTQQVLEEVREERVRDLVFLSSPQYQMEAVEDNFVDIEQVVTRETTHTHEIASITQMQKSQTETIHKLERRQKQLEALLDKQSLESLYRQVYKKIERELITEKRRRGV